MPAKRKADADLTRCGDRLPSVRVEADRKSDVAEGIPASVPRAAGMRDASSCSFTVARIDSVCLCGSLSRATGHSLVGSDSDDDPELVVAPDSIFQMSARDRDDGDVSDLDGCSRHARSYCCCDRYASDASAIAYRLRNVERGPNLPGRMLHCRAFAWLATAVLRPKNGSSHSVATAAASPGPSVRPDVRHWLTSSADDPRTIYQYIRDTVIDSSDTSAPPISTCNAGLGGVEGPYVCLSTVCRRVGMSFEDGDRHMSGYVDSKLLYLSESVQYRVLVPRHSIGDPFRYVFDYNRRDSDKRQTYSTVLLSIPPFSESKLDPIVAIITSYLRPSGMTAPLPALTPPGERACASQTLMYVCVSVRSCM